MPAPCTPTTPTLDPASILSVSPRNAGSGCRGYDNTTSRNSTAVCNQPGRVLSRTASSCVASASEFCYPAKYCVDIREPPAIEQRRVTLGSSGARERSQVFDGDALHCVHAQLEFGVGSHEPDNSGRERYSICKDETRLGWRQFVLVGQRLSIQRQGRAARHRRPQRVEADGEPVGQRREVQFCRICSVNQSSEALREARERAVEGTKRLEAVERLVEQRVDRGLRGRVDALEVAREQEVFLATLNATANTGIKHGNNHGTWRPIANRDTQGATNERIKNMVVIATDLSTAWMSVAKRFWTRPTGDAPNQATGLRSTAHDNFSWILREARSAPRFWNEMAMAVCTQNTAVQIK